MRKMATALTALLVLSGSECLRAQVSGPESRVLTDPQSISSPSSANVRPVPIDDLYFTRNLAGASWSPDGKEIALTMDMSGRANLWKVSSAGGWPVQLVQSDERQYAATWSPDGEWIAYQQDSQGNELWDIFVVPSSGGVAQNLTATPDVREQEPRWSPDGKTIAVNCKPKDGTVYDLALLDWNTRRLRKLPGELTSDHSWSSVAWSPDGATLYANRMDISFTDSDVYAVNVASGATTNLTPHKGKVLYFAHSLSPDGKTLLLTSSEKGGFLNVALLDISARKLQWVTNTRWEALAGDFSPAGDSFTYTLNGDGLIDTYLVDRRTLDARKLPMKAGLNSPVGSPTAYAPSGRLLLLSHESSVQPGDYFVYDIASGASRQVTQSAVASLSAAAMPESQIVHYKTFDGQTISALLWMPFNMQRDGSHPALVLPHGGPTGQVIDDWSPRVAALVSRGYICIAPNVRGSTGYGLEFQRANHQDLGGGDLQDEVYAAKFLQATGYADAKKIGITGGSYGGFMTLMAIGRTPDLWAAAVEMYGIIDWSTMLQHSDAQLQQYERTLLGDPVKDKSVYQAASPITYIHNVKAPLLVLQGANDPRVPQEEAEQVVDLLKKDGKTVEAHYYPNEGHGFEKRENHIDSIRRTVDWFDKYLKAQP